MTPAPISVDGAPAKVHRYDPRITPNLKTGRVDYDGMAAFPNGKWVLHSDYAALLHQLAEARILIEDAGSALRVMIATAKAARWPITAGQMVPLNMARQEVRRIAAFLAASGGA